MTTFEDNVTARAWVEEWCSNRDHDRATGSLADLLDAERAKAWNEAIDKAYDVLNELTDAFVKEESVDRYNVAADAGARVRALRRP